jgi:hypothetical protein
LVHRSDSIITETGERVTVTGGLQPAAVEEQVAVVGQLVLHLGGVILSSDGGRVLDELQDIVVTGVRVVEAALFRGRQVPNQKQEFDLSIVSGDLGKAEGELRGEREGVSSPEREQHLC